MFRIVKPPAAFVSRRDDAGNTVSAFDVAATWLAGECDGWEPVQVRALGNDARVTLDGGDVDALLVLRRTSATKGKGK